jgi:Zn2+/Cd2+-exporting ATPase
MTQKLQLDIPLILPEITDASDACVERLTSELAARPGVEQAHIMVPDNGTPALLCIHYDP